jgi:hypothetical protein
MAARRPAYRQPLPRVHDLRDIVRDVIIPCVRVLEHEIIRDYQILIGPSLSPHWMRHTNAVKRRPPFATCLLLSTFHCENAPKPRPENPRCVVGSIPTLGTVPPQTRMVPRRKS